MKKILSIILLALISITAVFSLVACNDDTTTPIGEKGIRIKAYEDGYEVIGYIDEGKGVTELDILEAVKLKTGKADAKVLKIREKSFSGNDTLVTVEIPSTVEYIGAGAFEKMTKLESITIPFVGKTAVADIEIGTGLDTEDKSVDAERNFGHIFGAEEYAGGSLVTTYYNDKKDTNSAYTGSITTYIPETLKEINVEPAESYNVPTFGFAGLTRVQVNFGEKVTGIGDKAFFMAYYTDKQLYVPATVTFIHTTAFEEFTSIKAIAYDATSTIDWTKIELKEDVTAEPKA